MISHVVSQAAPLVGARVEIHGTSSAGHMNGKCGVAIELNSKSKDRNKWHYTVILDSGEALKVKPTNVRAEGTDSACKANGKTKKGKGERGRRRQT